MEYRQKEKPSGNCGQLESSLASLFLTSAIASSSSLIHRRPIIFLNPNQLFNQLKKKCNGAAPFCEKRKLCSAVRPSEIGHWLL
jgi:hypothetical protein